MLRRRHFSLPTVHSVPLPTAVFDYGRPRQQMLVMPPLVEPLHVAVPQRRLTYWREPLWERKPQQHVRLHVRLRPSSPFAECQVLLVLPGRTRR